MIRWLLIDLAVFPKDLRTDMGVEAQEWAICNRTDSPVMVLWKSYWCIVFHWISCFPRSEMPLRRDEKFGKIGRKSPDFHFRRYRGEVIHKERLFLYLQCLDRYRNTTKC